MVKGALGFRVISEINRPPKELVARFKRVTLGNIADMLGVGGVVGPAIRPMVPLKERIAGPAVTVKTRSGDYLMIVQAMKVAQPGDILIVDNGGGVDICVWGGILSAKAADCGIAGFITDGAVRDLEEIRASGFPVFATGLSAVAPTKEGPGEVNVPIALGGVVVRPGDVVIADEEGVVVVPLEQAEYVCARAEEAKVGDEQAFREIATHQWKEKYFAAADDIVRRKGGIIS